MKLIISTWSFWSRVLAKFVKYEILLFWSALLLLYLNEFWWENYSGFVKVWSLSPDCYLLPNLFFLNPGLNGLCTTSLFNIMRTLILSPSFFIMNARSLGVKPSLFFMVKAAEEGSSAWTKLRRALVFWWTIAKCKGVFEPIGVWESALGGKSYWRSKWHSFSNPWFDFCEDRYHRLLKIAEYSLYMSRDSGVWFLLSISLRRI